MMRVFATFVLACPLSTIGIAREHAWLILAQLLRSPGRTGFIQRQASGRSQRMR
jgi:hypothetical protein